MAPRPFVVASFNMHAGVNGFGVPYDVIAACAHISADVLALEEVFAPDDGPSLAQQVASTLGYHAIEARLGRLIVFNAEGQTPSTKRWGPSLLLRFTPQAIVASRDTQRERRSERRSRAARRGSIAIALLSRLPFAASEVVTLPRLRRDRVERKAIVATIGTTAPLRVIATHVGHITHGSIRQIAALGVEFERSDLPTVLLGDMNCWGPPLEHIVGARRAVRGATWPSWRPHSQLDHIFVNDRIVVHGASVLADGGSDHRAVRAALTWPEGLGSTTNGNDHAGEPTGQV